MTDSRSDFTKLSKKIIPDLNNIVRAIEDEGDRCYLGSTNDADDLKKIANWLERKFRDRPQPPGQSDDALVEWIEGRIAAETASAKKCYAEADAFEAITEYDWSPAVRTWRQHGDQATKRLNRWQAMRAVITDRDEWRQQHENLLSVRQSDLEALHVREAAAKAELDLKATEAMTLRDRLAAAKADAKRLAEENARLRKMLNPEWFYLAGDMSSDRCRFSAWEVIDEDWAPDHNEEGAAIVQIETATRCPDIWALVHFFTEEEKDARQSDDEYEIIEFASEAEAQAALAAFRESRDV